MSKSIITISNLHIYYNNNEILKNINLNIKEGDFIYLIGETGSEKVIIEIIIQRGWFPERKYPNQILIYQRLKIEILHTSEENWE